MAINYEALKTQLLHECKQYPFVFAVNRPISYLGGDMAYGVKSPNGEVIELKLFGKAHDIYSPTFEIHPPLRMISADDPKKLFARAYDMIDAWLRNHPVSVEPFKPDLMLREMKAQIQDEADIPALCMDYVVKFNRFQSRTVTVVSLSELFDSEALQRFEQAALLPLPHEGKINFRQLF